MADESESDSESPNVMYFEAMRASGRHEMAVVRFDDIPMSIVVVADLENHRFLAGPIHMLGEWDENGHIDGQSDENVPEMLIGAVQHTVRCLAGFEEWIVVQKSTGSA